MDLTTALNQPIGIMHHLLIKKREEDEASLANKTVATDEIVEAMENIAEGEVT